MMILVKLVTLPTPARKLNALLGILPPFITTVVSDDGTLASDVPNICIK
jgi:hypothetical protein